MCVIVIIDILYLRKYGVQTNERNPTVVPFTR